MFQNNYGEHDAELVRIAKAHAAGLIGKCGYTRSDADDVLQDLMIAGLTALPRFDALRSKRSTFLYRTLRAKVMNLARDMQRKKRARTMEVFSLDAPFPIDESEDTVWGDVIGIGKTLTEDGVPRYDRACPRTLRMDIKEALSDLPPKLRELCRLHSLHGYGDARLAAGMAYSTHHRAIKRIRVFLERRGFSPQSLKKSGRDHAPTGNNTPRNP